MALLDRFRQPVWKHPDRSVRATAVQELNADEQEALASVARDDPDPAIRRIALRKLDDFELLGETARRDPDESVRDEARDILLTTALEAKDVGGGAAALSQLNESKALLLVAKSAGLEPVSHSALSRLLQLNDRKALVSVASHANHVTTRLAALEGIVEPDDLTAIATKSEYQDVAIAAINRITDHDLLEAVATRARQKAAAR
ncbi:MAG: hypothetical protein ACRD1T_27895, partial [Acidimicrobiia bacterium]